MTRSLTRGAPLLSERSRPRSRFVSKAFGDSEPRNPLAADPTEAASR